MKIEFGDFEIPEIVANPKGIKARNKGLIDHFVAFDIAHEDKKMMKVECENVYDARSVFQTLRMKINYYNKGKYNGKYNVIIRNRTVFVIRREK